MNSQPLFLIIALLSSHYRNSPVEPFSDDSILEVSQGPNMIIPR